MPPQFYCANIQVRVSILAAHLFLRSDEPIKIPSGLLQVLNRLPFPFIAPHTFMILPLR